MTVAQAKGPGPFAGPSFYIPSISFPCGPGSFHVTEKEYAAMEAGFRKFSMRTLLMAGAEDTLALAHAPEDGYITLLRECGAGGNDRIIVSPEAGSSCLAEDIPHDSSLMEKIRNWEGHLEYYMATKKEVRLAQEAGKDAPDRNAQAASLLNDKVFFTRMLEDLGMAQPETFTGGADAVAYRLGKENGFPVIVRSSHSVGGAAVWTATGPNEKLALRKIVEKKQGETFLLQRLLDVSCSPNIQYYIGETETCLLGKTQQVMKDGIRHTGNIFKGVEEADVDGLVTSQGRRLAEEAGAMGCRGVIGIDFIVTSGGDVYPVEMNARHNTSTHALVFANRLLNGDPLVFGHGGRAACLRWPSGRGALTAMEWMEVLGDLTFDSGKRTGILPYDCRWENLEAVVIGKDEYELDWLIRQGEKAA